MAFDKIKEGLSESESAVRDYVDATAEQFKLQTFRFAMKLVVNSVKTLVLGLFLLLTFFFLSMALGFFLNTMWQSDFLGFLAIGLFYMIIGIIVYLLRSRLERPILRSVSKYYFEE